jgi:hypothetical protein
VILTSDIIRVKSSDVISSRIEIMTCTAFAGENLIASGELATVARRIKRALDGGERQPILIFDDSTGRPIDVDFRGSPDDIAARLLLHQGDGTEIPRGPGRPKLGVVAREVTLLPRHWEWLGTQPGGASVALRKLVEEARRTRGGKDGVRQAQETTYRFMLAMAGDRPGFEEALRALYSGQRPRFVELLQSWPRDIRDHAMKISAAAFSERNS